MLYFESGFGLKLGLRLGRRLGLVEYLSARDIAVAIVLALAGAFLDARGPTTLVGDAFYAHIREQLQQEAACPQGLYAREAGS